MKSHWFGAAVVGAVAHLTAVGAFAADLPPAPVYTKAPPVAAPYSWTGFYVGGNVGGAWGTSDATSSIGPGFNPVNAAFLNALDSPTLKPSGFTGGLQAGYNYQAGNVVFGVEADFDYFELSRSFAASAPIPIGGGTFNVSSSVKTDWLFTARPRIGYAAGNALVYATGGLAVTNIRYKENFFDTPPFPFGDIESSSVSSTRAGWTVGGGVEYALSNQWSAKLEYLYADFGSVSTTGTDIFIGLPYTTFAHNVDLRTNIVRGGINYKLY